MYNKGDFHIHSTFSDGNCTPSQIIELAKKRNVDIISITDHNSTLGLSEAIRNGYKLGVKVIPGVELSTKYNDTRVHILGYFKDDSYQNELLIDLLNNVKKHRASLIRTTLKSLINCQNKNSKSGKLSVDEGIKILKFFGATVVLAHPVLLPRKDLEEILKFNFDGIEAKYFSNTEKDTYYFINYAKNNKLIYTAGSDFHKSNDFFRSHGLIGDVYLNSQEIAIFLNKLNN